MNDLIAIKIEDRKQGKVAFITWGRIFDRLDTEYVRQEIVKAAARFGVTDIKSSSVCDNLGEVSQYPYFYESLMYFSWKPIPFGKGYKAWKSKKKVEIKKGKDIYFLGSLKLNLYTPTKHARCHKK